MADCGGQLTVTITNLPEIDQSGFQVFGLNKRGDLTGFFYVAYEHPAHVFSFCGGQLTDLGTLGGDVGQGNAINSSGQIAGESEPAASVTSHAFFYDGHQLTDLGTLGGSSSRAAIINDLGQAAGSSLTPGDAATHGFLFSSNTISDVGTLGGTYSIAMGLNKSGAVVGQSTLTNNELHAFISTDSGLLDLGTLGGQYSAAFNINDSGVVVGESSIDDSTIHPFLFANNTMTDLQGLGGTYATAYTVNSSNQVLGLSTLPGDAVSHAFVFANGNLTDLGTLGGDNSYPSAQNNLGQVVGQSDTATDGPHAFLWQNGAITDLNNLLPTDSGWRLDLAVLINDSGRIVGIGEHNSVAEWFIMDLGTGNNPPVAVAAQDTTTGCQTTVTLDGSQSSDPDGDALAFEWTCAGHVLGTNSTLTGTFALGTNVVTLKVTDPCGASSQASVTVTVLDTNPPALLCPGAMTLSADADCQAVLPDLLGQLTVSDNCTPAALIKLDQSPAAGTSLSLGTHTVTLMATDGSGNVASCPMLVTVADITAPLIVSGPLLDPVRADSNCHGPTPDVTSQIVATDNCTPANALVITQVPVAGSPVALGSNVIVVTVKDGAGNQTQGTLSFFVIDKTPPTISSAPPSLTIPAQSNCQAPVPDFSSSITAVDNCTAGQLSISQSPAAGTLLGPGQYNVTVTVADAAGNLTSRVIPLQVVGDGPVIVSAPDSVTVSPNRNCRAHVPNIVSSIVVTHGCTGGSEFRIRQSPRPGSEVDLGQSLITVTVTDPAGHSMSRAIVLNVVDTTPPEVHLKASPETLGLADHRMVPINVWVKARDNCDDSPVSKIISITCSEPTAPGDIVITGDFTASLAASRNAYDTPRIYTITVQSTDHAGNSATAADTVRVQKRRVWERD